MSSCIQFWPFHCRRTISDMKIFGSGVTTSTSPSQLPRLFSIVTRICYLGILWTLIHHTLLVQCPYASFNYSCSRILNGKCRLLCGKTGFRESYSFATASKFRTAARFSVKYLPLQFYHLTATQYSKFLSYLKVFVLNLVSIIKYPAFVLYILCWAVDYACV